MKRRGKNDVAAKHGAFGDGGMGPSAESMQQLKRLDIYARPKREFQRATLHGAAVSIFLILASVALTWRELVFSMRTETIERLFVNSTISPTINVTFDVVFSRIPCGYLSLDAEDSTGSPQKNVVYEVIRTRLGLDGVPIGDEEKHEMGNTLKELLSKEVGDSAEGSKGRGEDDCNCYGAGAEGECCKTCQDVKGAYRRKGWKLDVSKVAVCVEEGVGVTTDLKGDAPKGVVEDEGCRLAGFLEMTSSHGSFHFAPGHRLHRQANHLSLIDRIQMVLESFNTTHTIHALTFGEQPPVDRAPRKHMTASTMLHGHQKTVQDTHAMHQYFLQVVPTVYRFANGFTVNSNQYSVTEHLKLVHEGPSRGLPGVYFIYDVSPVQALVEEKKRGFLAFLTGACGVVGGVYTILGLVHTGIDGILSRGIKNRLR